MNRQRAGKRGRNRQNKQRRDQMISHPPSINGYEVRHNTRLRFTSNAAITGSVITFQNLLDTILVATTAIAVYDLFATVKVRAVEVWSVPALGTASTVSVLFDGATAGSIGDQKLHTDTSMGIEPAHVRAVPQKMSLAANYQISAAAAAFFLTCPSGSVVDVELSFIGAYDVPKLAQNASVGASIGATLLRGLDGLAIAATQLPPVYAVGSI